MSHVNLYEDEGGGIKCLCRVEHFRSYFNLMDDVHRKCRKKVSDPIQINAGVPQILGLSLFYFFN